MVDGFIMTFSFEDDCPHIDVALHIVKKNIFENEVPCTWKLDWVTQLHNVMESYNITTKEEEDHRNIDITEYEGHHEVNGPEIEMHDIMKLLKTKKVNIGLEDEPKFVTIGDYWDEGIVSKITYLLHEYQELFPTKF